MAESGNTHSCIYATTAGVDSRLVETLHRMLPGGCLVLTGRTPLPIGIDYGTPDTLGADRIAFATGVRDLVPDSCVLIVDAGTCITLDLLKGDIFMGGNISPGLTMRLKAMHCFSASLPLVTLPATATADTPLGHDTCSALRQGALQGAIGEITHTFALARAMHGASALVITGGDTPLLSPALADAGLPLRHCDNPVMHGLLKILLYNEHI